MPIRLTLIPANLGSPEYRTDTIYMAIGGPFRKFQV